MRRQAFSGKKKKQQLAEKRRAKSEKAQEELKEYKEVSDEDSEEEIMISRTNFMNNVQSTLSSFVKSSDNTITGIYSIFEKEDPGVILKRKEEAMTKRVQRLSKVTKESMNNAGSNGDRCRQQLL
jgi:uncharacterized protein with ATP-grasp and redox domains